MGPSTEQLLNDNAPPGQSWIGRTGAAPVMIIGVAFSLVGAIVCSRVDDAALRVITMAGVVVTVGRLAALARPRSMASALGSFVFAACLGALGARTLLVGDEPTHTLVIGLTFGYGAGLLMRGVSSPWISVPCLFLGVTPLIAAAFRLGDTASTALGGLTLLLLVGGLERLKRVHEEFVAQVALRRKFENLARVDELTGLANRLALREFRDELHRWSEAGAPVAVHCLDLDRFKPINDALGHAAGDAALRIVAERLTRTVGPGDLVARVGGDEFVVVQTRAAGEDGAGALARRLAEAIRAPFLIHGRSVSVEVSVGTAVAPVVGLNLDDLIRRADAALYAEKTRRGGTGAGAGAGTRAVVSRDAEIIPMPASAVAFGGPLGPRRSPQRARSHG